MSATPVKQNARKPQVLKGFRDYMPRQMILRRRIIDTFRTIFEPSRSFAKARGKKLYVIEAGCVERNPGEKAKWLRGARHTIKAWPEIRAFSYNSENTDCNYLLTTSESSLRAFKAMGKDPYFRKR